MSAEQIAQIVNARLALANQELIETLNQRFAQFRSEVEPSVSQVATDVTSLRSKLDEVTQTANDTYTAQKQETKEVLDRMQINISRLDNEVVQSATKVGETIQLIQSHIQAAESTYVEFKKRFRI